MIRLNAYIHFQDNARQALTFYQSVFGGKLTTTTFKDGGVPNDSANENNLMHGQLTGDNGIVLMAADTPKEMEYKPGNSIGMSLSGEDEAVLKGYWDKLSAGAKIDQPLQKAPWGDTFGMLTDQFGIEWMVNITAVHH